MNPDDVPAIPPEFEQSSEINHLLPAVVKMQAALEPARRDANNPFHGSRYADLAAVMAVARKPMGDNGLCLVSTHYASPGDDGAIVVHTRLYHETGEYFGCRLKIRVDVPSKKERDRGIQTIQPTAQELGSAITYGKRYNSMALTGVVAEGEDDDGNRASRRDREEDGGQGSGNRPGRDRGTKGDRNQGGDPGGAIDNERAARKRAENEEKKRLAMEKANREGENPPAGGGDQPKPETDEEVEAKAKVARELLSVEDAKRFAEYAETILAATAEPNITAMVKGLQSEKGKTPERIAVDAHIFAALRPTARKAIRAIRAKNPPPADPGKAPEQGS